VLSQQLPKRTNFPLPDFTKKGGAISAFYRIFGQSFEMLKQLMFWEHEKDIGKTTVDSWRHEPMRSKGAGNPIYGSLNWSDPLLYLYLFFFL